jgi:hypothetical protein
MSAGTHAMTSPCISAGVIDPVEMRLIGNAVPDHTERKRVRIRRRIEIKMIFPMSDLIVSLDFMMIYPIHIIWYGWDAQ